MQKSVHPLPTVTCHSNSMIAHARNYQFSPWHQCWGPHCQQVNHLQNPILKSACPGISCLRSRSLEQWFAKCGPWTTASALPGNLLEMHFPGPVPRSTDTAALEVTPSNLLSQVLEVMPVEALPKKQSLGKASCANDFSKECSEEEGVRK